MACGKRELLKVRQFPLGSGQTVRVAYSAACVRCRTLSRWVINTEARRLLSVLWIPFQASVLRAKAEQRAQAGDLSYRPLGILKLHVYDIGTPFAHTRLEVKMPEQSTVERAREDARQGKAPSTQAAEFVHEEIEHVREGKHGARSPQQAIAIGLSKARRAGVKVPPPKKEGGCTARIEAPGSKSR